MSREKGAIFANSLQEYFQSLWDDPEEPDIPLHNDQPNKTKIAQLCGGRRTALKSGNNQKAIEVWNFWISLFAKRRKNNMKKASVDNSEKPLTKNPPELDKAIRKQMRRLRADNKRLQDENTELKAAVSGLKRDLAARDEAEDIMMETGLGCRRHLNG